MLKLLIVTPNPTVYDATVRIVQTTKFDAEVIQTTSRQVVEDVSKAMEGCTGIVVARGNQAQLLKKHVEYPVSEITFSGQEMAGFVKQACDLIPHKHPKIAFVGFRHMYSDVESIGALANADVRVYYAGSSDMVAQVTRKPSSAAKTPATMPRRMGLRRCLLTTRTSASAMRSAGHGWQWMPSRWSSAERQSSPPC